MCVSVQYGRKSASIEGTLVVSSAKVVVMLVQRLLGFGDDVLQREYKMKLDDQNGYTIYERSGSA